MKSSKNIYISNKISVKDYGKPKILFSSLLLFDILHYQLVWFLFNYNNSYKPPLRGYNTYLK